MRTTSSWSPLGKSEPGAIGEASSRVFKAKVNRSTGLDLSGLGLTTLPSELFKCSQLRSLDISDNHLSLIPQNLSKLSNLKKLDASKNKIQSFERGLSGLGKLSVLDVSDNQLVNLPKQVRGMKNLGHLDVSNNLITILEGVVGDLPNLIRLYANNNQIKRCPEWVGHLLNLETLDLSYNNIDDVAFEPGPLRKLTSINLSNNSLEEIPAAIGELSFLRSLDLRKNPLRRLPPGLGRLKYLGELQLDSTANLVSPPADVIAQGTTAVLAYLRSLLDENAPIYPHQVKLVLVGQGNVGKTCLVNNLLRLPYNEHQGKTEGVEIRPLLLQHPDDANQNMTLAMWDFGGQEIQHATHQFFLTNRSLFVLLYNARQDVGRRGGNVQYWLEMIKSRAPDSPIFLVATHCDQEPARVTTEYWRSQFPNIRGVFEVGNQAGKGIEELREALRQESARLPVMQDAWNRRWLSARQAVKDMGTPYIAPEQAWEIMRGKGVEPDELSVVAGRMHLLGDIVYFRENAFLKDTIVLDPEWLTRRVCEAVSSDIVQRRLGVLSNQLLEEIWPHETHQTRFELLNFMEQYDLSYRTDSNREESIVVQALPDSPPDAILEEWQKLDGSNTLQLRYKFKANLPPGIPSWFIAREHRFTMNLHWRYGALFMDRSREHKALVQLTDTAGDLNVLLSVRGPEPIKFFSILQDGLEETLSRYPGLEVQRMVPCPGTLCGKDCPFEFGLETLEKYREKGLLEIRCGQSINQYEVMNLLFGITVPKIEPSIERFGKMLSEIGSKVEDVSASVQQLTENLGFQQREFTKLFHALQSQTLTHCPSVFFILPPDENWSKKFLTNQLELQLCCEMPGCWHKVEGAGRYKITDPSHWLTRVAPYFSQLVKVLRVASPALGAAFELAYPGLSSEFKANIKLAEELPKLFPELSWDEGIVLEGDALNRATGVAFQALRETLVISDPNLVKTGLNKVLMPEGNYLWLCPQHCGEVLAFSAS